MFLWIVGIILILVLPPIGLCIYCFFKCFYSSGKAAQDPYAPLHGKQYIEKQDDIYALSRNMDEVDFEAVTIRSYDGLSLYGRYYHIRDGAPVKILFHGYRSMALRDGGGGFYLAQKLGMNVLAVDQRAHGNSQGHVITFGIRERRDCLSWIRYINNRCGSDTPIILSGLSMGAATVVMATALHLPKNVLCVFADCPYSSPGEIIKKVCGDVHIPASFAYPFIYFSARLFGGFRMNQTSAIEAAKVSKVPIFLFHGTGDRFVPWEMSEQIHAGSNGCTKLELFDGAGHGLSYIGEPQRYGEIVMDYLRQFPALTSCFENV